MNLERRVTELESVGERVTDTPRYRSWILSELARLAEHVSPAELSGEEADEVLDKASEVLSERVESARGGAGE